METLKNEIDKMMSAEKNAIKTLSDYIKGHGGIVNMSNPDNKKDNAYAYVWNMDSDYPASELHINCVQYDEKNGIISIHATEYNEAYTDFSEIENDDDNWYALQYDQCFVAQTLYSILEVIDEYTED